MKRPSIPHWFFLLLAINPAAFAQSHALTRSGKPSKLVEAVHRNSIADFRTLVAAGEEIDAFHYDYETALIASAKYERVEFVDELIRAKADLDKQNSTGWNALMWAAQRGNVQIVKILVDAGSKIDEQNKDGCTAFLLASRDGNLETINYLINAGADMGHKNNKGDTALLLAAEGSKPAILERLLKLGFDPNSFGSGNFSAIAKAARSPEALKVLLAGGAKIDLQIETGVGVRSTTALEMAVVNGWTESVEVLISAGANPNLSRTGKISPLRIAINRGDKEMIELLKKAGAKDVWKRDPY
ncbi:MAG: hypothetical protein DMF62_12850 [Acidobacteria bacterium]|nr:MAG: hypothetical protein DMF62_12850 [Acidobacteriota bacterium]